MNDKIFYMNEALTLAKAAAAEGEIPVGAVIVKDGKIIARGKNRRENGGGATAHAEIEAINAACAVLGTWRLGGCTMYVSLEPCPMCAGAIINARIDRVVFAASDVKGGALGGLFNLLDTPLDTRLKVEGGVMADAATEVLNSFFAARREEAKKIKRLTRDFYSQSADIVAPALLGKILCRRVDGEVIRSRITETECYKGEDDTACHAHKGKTARNSVMWSRGGTVYVYLCYGMHNMLNIVTAEKGEPEAVLIRGVEAVNGPGRVTKYFSIDREQNGADVILSDAIWIEDDGTPSPQYECTARVGIDYAAPEDRDRPWRYIKK